MVTSVKLYGDLGFDNTYNHVMDFASKNARDNWFASRTAKTITNANYNKIQNELYLEMGLTEAQTYCYCIITIDNKAYYNFIDSCKLVNDKTVAISLEIDVWQTYLYTSTGASGFTLGESFIARQHCDRWSSGSSYPIRKTPNVESVKGFEKIISKQSISPETTHEVISGRTSDLIGYCIISYVATIGDSNTEFSYILMPVNISYQEQPVYVSDINNIAYKCLSLQDIIQGKLEEYIGIQPSSIVNISYLSNINDCVLAYASVDKTVGVITYKAQKLIIGTHTLYARQIMDESEQPTGYAYFPIDNFIRQINSKVDTITISTLDSYFKPENNANYSQTYEPALHIHPIKTAWICDGIGNKLFKMDEYDTDMNKSLFVKYMTIITPTDCYMIVYVGSKDTCASKNQISIVTAPTFDLTSNNWLNYKLSNRETDREMIQQQVIQGTINSLLGTLTFGAMMKASVFGPTNANNASISKSMGVMAGAGLIQSTANAYFAYQQQDIKERQIQNQPNVLQVQGNIISSLYLGNTHLQFILMSIDETMLNIMADEYKKYGYLVNEVTIPNLKTRKYYNFIKTNLCKVNGSLNMDIKSSIATILNKGVTIWHMDYTTTIGDYSKENIERSLLT